MNIVIVVIFGVLSVMQYLFGSIAYQTMNPLAWPPREFVMLGLYVVSLAVLLGLDWFIKRSPQSAEEILGGVCDLHEYVKGEKRIADCFLAHYGNLGAVGFLLAIMIFSLRPHVDHIPKELLFMGVPMMILFVVVSYALVACKWFYGLKRLYSDRVVAVLTIILVIIDMQGIGYIIAAVPS